MMRLGTRGSRLALTQSGWVADRLRAAGHEVEMVIIKTEGDQKQDRAFAQIGQPGVFVREIETALLDGRIDLAVHSYKDLPSAGPDGLTIAAVPERLDVADRLLVRAESLDAGRKAASDIASLLPLKDGAVVGTASARRIALLQHFRPDLKTELLRGNLPRRVERLRDGDYDAILLAAAGLERMDRDGGLDMSGIEQIRLDPWHFVPAPSQGALALQTRVDDPAAAAALALDDADGHRAVRAERAVLSRVEGGCHVAFGAWCRSAGSDAELDVVAVLGGPRGMARAEGTGTDADGLADRLVTELKSALR